MVLALAAACAPVPIETRTAALGSTSTSSSTDPQPETHADTDPVQLPQWYCPEVGATLAFDPSEPVAGDLVTVSVTAPIGYGWIDLNVTPPTGWTQEPMAITGSGPFTWSYPYRIDVPERYDFAFTADTGALTVCTGSVWVR